MIIAFVYSENLNGKYHMENTYLDGRIILKCAIKESSVRVWTGFMRLMSGASSIFFSTS